MTLSKSAKIYAGISAAIIWFALILQFYLQLQNRTGSARSAAVDFFSYFTILTNLLTAICCTSLLLHNTSSFKKFFSSASVQTAIAVYIFVVALVYNYVLRSQWNPQGWQRLADELLHVANPILFILFWLLFTPKQSLRIKNTFAWLLYPFAYSLYTLLRGALVHKYPYPFINADNIGYSRAFINTLILFLIFFFLSGLFIILGKWFDRK
ncbi:MAG TPA: Pr6Pr family membrane protein [Chitinophagaceae bacterium]|nr:Pr6Pr family membrane protein [Chitinophagaceae bacterium]